MSSLSFLSFQSTTKGVCALGGEGRVGEDGKVESLICNICHFPWCKYSHHVNFNLATVYELAPTVSVKLTTGSHKLLSAGHGTPPQKNLL